MGELFITTESCRLPDGSANNLGPQATRRKGTLASANGDQVLVTLDFDASQREQVWVSLSWPASYVSTPILTVFWGASAVTGNVIWGVRLGAVTPGDADTPYSHAMATAQTATGAVPATTNQRVVATPITITNTDSVAPGDLVTLQIYRDGANGSDTCVVDAQAEGFLLSWT